MTGRRLRKIFRIRNFFFLLAILYVGSAVVGTYWQNYVCRPGYHVIRSEADVIEEGKAWWSLGRYAEHGIPGYLDKMPNAVDWGATDSCCSVTRSFPEWRVSLQGVTTGEERPRRVSAVVKLSNCASIFAKDSYVFATPIRQ